MHNGPEKTQNPPHEHEEAPLTLDAFYSALAGEALVYSVSRLEPAIIPTDDGDMPVRGLLYTGEAYLTKESIEAQFGGGVYEIRACTLQQDWERKITLEVEGDPKPTHDQYFEFLKDKAVKHAGEGGAFPMGGASRVSRESSSSGPDTVMLQELISSIMQVLPPMLQKKAEDLRSGGDSSSPFDGAPADIRMPRDVALKLMKHLYAPEKPKTRSQFRLGLGLGAALSAIGVETLLEDVVSTLGERLGGSNSGRLMDLPLPVSYGIEEFEKNLPPSWMQPMPGGPVEGVSDPNGHEKWGIPGPTTSDEAPDDTPASSPHSDIMDNIGSYGNEIKAEAMRRWEQIEKEDPERFEDMTRRGLNPGYIFEHFEELFSEFFQSTEKKKNPDEK